MSISVKSDNFQCVAFFKEHFSSSFFQGTLDKSVRFTAKTSTAEVIYGIDDDDEDGGVVNDGDGLAWVVAKEPTLCVAHTPRDGSSAAVHCRGNLTLRSTDLYWKHCAVLI